MTVAKSSKTRELSRRAARAPWKEYVWYTEDNPTAVKNVYAPNETTAREWASKQAGADHTVNLLGEAHDFDVRVKYRDGHEANVHLAAIDEQDAQRRALAWGRDEPVVMQTAKDRRRGTFTTLKPTEHGSVVEVLKMVPSRPCERTGGRAKFYDIFGRTPQHWAEFCAKGLYVPDEIYSGSAKSEKSAATYPEVYNTILYMAPSTKAAQSFGWSPSRCRGKGNLCSFSTPGCRAACLDKAGKGGQSTVISGRLNKSRIWLTDPEGWVMAMRADQADILQRVMGVSYTGKDGGTYTIRQVAFRPNGTSDIAWEAATDGQRRTIFSGFGPETGAMFYDYTKWKPSKRQKPRGVPYTLTYSWNEGPESKRYAEEAIALGWPVAVAFKTAKEAKAVLKRGWWWRFPDVPTVDGDKHDLRAYDGGAAIVVLKPKIPGEFSGKAKMPEFIRSGRGFFQEMDRGPLTIEGERLSRRGGLLDRVRRLVSDGAAVNLARRAGIVGR